MSGYNARFVWYELMAKDLPGAETFYRTVVGWQTRDAGMGQPYLLLHVGNAAVGGMMTMPPEMQTMALKPAWSGYVGTADVDATVARLLAADGRLLRPASDIPEVGRFAVVADPQGASFVLFKPFPSEPPAVPAAGAPGTVGWHELHAVDGAKVFEFYSALFGWTRGEAIDMGS